MYSSWHTGPFEFRHLFGRYLILVHLHNRGALHFMKVRARSVVFASVFLCQTNHTPTAGLWPCCSLCLEHCLQDILLDYSLTSVGFLLKSELSQDASLTPLYITAQCGPPNCLSPHCRAPMLFKDYILVFVLLP